MSKSSESLTFSENRKENQNKRFEELVKDLIKESSLFLEKQLSPNIKLDIIRAIENNEVTLYLGNSARDRTLDTVCIV